MNSEENYCDFCGRLKEVGRCYLYAMHKDKILEKNENENYFKIIYYCQDCGEPYIPELFQQEKESTTNT